MQIVIDIPDKVYQDIQARDWNNSIWARDSLMRYIHEGVVLPKHHGRLIDAEQVNKRLQCWNTGDKFDFVLYKFAWHRIMEAPTVIDADKEAQECQPNS